MFFLLRLAFWAMVICLFLPGSGEDNRRLLSSAAQTLKDVRGFCERNPQVCEDARLTMTTVLTRFKSGAEMLQAMVAEGDEKEAPYAGEHVSASQKTDRTIATPPKWQDSLSTSDKQLPWHDPAASLRNKTILGEQRQDALK